MNKKAQIPSAKDNLTESEATILKRIMRSDLGRLLPKRARELAQKFKP